MSVKEQYRFGIGEWYGRSLIHLTAEERKNYALLQRQRKTHRPPQPCLPRLAENPQATCDKEGGVCSLRLYGLSEQGVFVAPGLEGALRTTCPSRFHEGMKVFQWIGETILQHPDPRLVKEVGFLERPRRLLAGSERGDNVGRIDMVLVHPAPDSFSWCALEMQAVYFSGNAMKNDFNHIAGHDSEEIPFPAGKRRPDYRSSQPKRLMPQLQIKVPTLRRWGKKMAVVVDRNFFEAMGEMDRVADISNCDIVWFVVKYRETGTQAVLEPDLMRFTSLERAVEGLTGGTPVALPEFEARIRKKLGRQPLGGD